jgi:hypothetical protein
MASDVDPARFIAGLRFLAEDLRKRGAGEIWCKRGEDWLSAGWKQDASRAGSEGSLLLAKTIDCLAEQMEFCGICDVTLIQTNEVETGAGGRLKFTGERAIFARWKWNKAIIQQKR